jgi:Tol biopolymer transport system component
MNPTVSPDGKIAYACLHEEHDQICIMNSDGSHERVLTQSPESKASPLFSPDGRKIVFIGGGENHGIYVMDADGSNITPLTRQDGFYSAIRFSPDGRKIAFTLAPIGNKNRQIYVMDAGGSNNTRLTAPPWDNAEPVFSPDSRKIVFLSDRDNMGNYPPFQIFVMNADGSNVTRLINPPEAVSSATFSPDGKIVFVSDRGGKDQIYSMNLDGSGVTRLTDGQASYGRPIFSPDGRKILFSCEDNGTEGLCLMDADGSNVTHLPPLPQVLNIGFVFSPVPLPPPVGPSPEAVAAEPRGSPDVRSIHMADKVNGWALTDDYVLRSTDGGTAWRDVSPPRPFPAWETSIETADFLTPSVAWVGMSRGIAHQIFHTVDGGRSWRSATIPVLGVISIDFVNERDGWLLSFEGAYMGGNEEVDVYHSTDGGETWIRVASARHDDESSGLPVNGGKDAIAFLSTTTGWATGGGSIIAHEGVFLYTTRDDGRTWRQQNLPPPPGVTPPWTEGTSPPTFFTARDGVIPVFYSADRSASSGTIGVFYVTHDGGTTWTPTTPVSVTESHRPSSFADSNHGWVTDGDVLYETSDGGHQWATLHPTPSFTDVTQLEFISPEVGWAVKKASPFLLRTVDGGQTWAPVTYTISGQKR